MGVVKGGDAVDEDLSKQDSPKDWGQVPQTLIMFFELGRVCTFHVWIRRGKLSLVTLHQGGLIVFVDPFSSNIWSLVPWKSVSMQAFSGEGFRGLDQFRLTLRWTHTPSTELWHLPHLL